MERQHKGQCHNNYQQRFSETLVEMELHRWGSTRPLSEMDFLCSRRLQLSHSLILTESPRYLS